MTNDYLDKRLTQVENHTFNFEECFKRIELLESYVANLEDTLNRIGRELGKSLDTQLKQTEVNRKLMEGLKHHETVWARIDNDVQLFGNKVVGYGLEKQDE